MINKIYRLVDIKRIEMAQREVELNKDNLIVRPEYLSICAADQRYFLGKRKKEVLQKKLPIALIHEAIGRVLFDLKGEVLPGTKVALIPNQSELVNGIKGNYQSRSVFLSSNADGFMQDVLSIRRDRVVNLPENHGDIYVLSELVSVAFNAIESLNKDKVRDNEIFGIWGDGSVGFVMGVVIKSVYPKTKIYVFGKNSRKLNRFSFADKLFYIDSISPEIRVDSCFECVGGVGSSEAINQMIDLINPQGGIVLLGVSEDPVSINTRTVLEKGIRLIGSSRSEKCDFIKAVKLIAENSIANRYLSTIISQRCEIKNIDDIYHAFEQDYVNDFKTILKWSI